MSGPWHFLLVDDDPDKRHLIGHYLTRSFPSASVFECSSGAEAIDYLKLHSVSAILTDHSMQPVNGIELIQWTRRIHPEIPILMVTGHPAIEQEALHAGATLVVSFGRFAEIGQILARLLNEKPPRPERF